MTLSKNQQSRLDELSKEWETGKPKMLEKFTVSDLKLLLEHHSDVQALIRRIANETSANAAPAYAYNNANTDKELSALRAELAQEKATNQRLQNENSALQTLIRQSRTDLEREQANTEQARAQVRDSLSRLNKCEADLKDAQTALERARNANQPPQVVRWLRQETELAERMGVADLPADTLQALTAVVAVFSQRNNLERLWDTLRERIDFSNRCASTEELALLNASITWTNINCPRTPIELVAAQGYDFDFDQQTRSRNTPTGESIQQTVLPGLAEGREIIKKPIVSTY